MQTRVRRLALLLFLLPAASACSRTGSSAPSKPPQRALAVRVAPVKAEDIVYRIQALGSLEAEELVQVTAEVEGAVSSVSFDEGLRVTPQTVLLRIDPDRYRLEAARAGAALRKAEADAKRAASELARRESLAREQLVAAEELNRARQEADRLQAEAESARALWQIAEQNQKRADVRPPRAGVINTRAATTGQFVKTGNVLATLVDVSRLRLRFKVSEAESLRARAGETVKFRIAALGQQEFPATIYHVGEVADPASRQVEVLAWVKNPGVLKPGFFAEVVLASESHHDALVVPEGAIQASERGFVAYAVEGGKARLRPVNIGLRTGQGTVEILSGLAAGESVVIEGSDRLADGVEVQVAGNAPAPSAASSPRS